MLPIFDETELPQSCDCRLRRLMVNDVPSAPHPGTNVFQAIVDVDNLGPSVAGELLRDFINLRVRLHHSLFVGEDVAVEVREEGEGATDMPDSQIIRVRKNVCRNIAPA